MIKDNIKSFNKYNELPQRVQVGFSFLSENDLSNYENGKYEILGSEIYAIVQDYESKPLENAKFEAHQKYIDIQYIIKGEEKIGVGNLSDFIETTGYDAVKDIVFLESKGDKPVFVELKANDFAIFYPEDAHMPCVAIDSPSYVKKVVVKVLK